MKTITLKHLAREFDMDPYKLRGVLRGKYGHASGGRWQWQEGQKSLKAIRDFLSKNYEKSTKA